MREDYYSIRKGITDIKGKEINNTFIIAQNTCILIISKSVALEYGLLSSSDVVVEKRQDGIMIRKSEI